MRENAGPFGIVGRIYLFSDTVVEHSVHGSEALEVVEGLGKEHVVLGGTVDIDVYIVLISVGAVGASDRAELGDVGGIRHACRT